MLIYWSFGDQETQFHFFWIKNTEERVRPKQLVDAWPFSSWTLSILLVTAILQADKQTNRQLANIDLNTLAVYQVLGQFESPNHRHDESMQVFHRAPWLEWPATQTVLIIVVATLFNLFADTPTYTGS